MDCSAVPLAEARCGPEHCPPEWRHHREHFQRRGWAVLPGLLTAPEARRFGAAFEAHHRHRRPESYEPRGGDGGGVMEELDSVQALWEDCPELRALAFHPSVAAAAAALLGVPSVRVLQDQANTKPPGGGPTFAHQDQPYLPVREPLTVAAWVPLCRGGSSATNGHMGYVSGSHRSGLKWHPALSKGADAAYPRQMQPFPPLDDPGRSILTHPLVADLPTEFVTVPEGSVAFHSGLTLHLSQPNRTEGWRHAYTTTYCASDCTVGSVMGYTLKPTAACVSPARSLSCGCPCRHALRWLVVIS